MGTSEFRSNTEATAQAACMITAGLGGYCTFALKAISTAAPVPGSTVHDGIGSQLRSALYSWFALLESDAKAIVSAGMSFEALDAELAKGLLGMGDSSLVPLR
ncbi:MAG: hypothetical protein LBG81_03540 [Coriobacteriaceae bacterium]|jgi:hypothetical protein|nr:hypothetical protein [Coriobacteriaceae bacterium]